MAAMHRPRPQPDPLDQHSRQHPYRRSTRRRPHHPHSAPRAARSARQPQRNTEPSTSDKLAVGDPIHRSAQHAPPPPPSACLTGIPRSGAPPTEVSADIPNRKPVASTRPNVSPTSHRSTHQARDPHPPRPGADNGSHRCIEVYAHLSFDGTDLVPFTEP